MELDTIDDAHHLARCFKSAQETFEAFKLIILRSIIVSDNGNR
jgi:hypothetical protein